MANEIKKFKGTFDFVGVLNDATMDDNGRKMDIMLRDNDIESEVKITLWNNKEARYYDLGSNTSQRLEGTKESIEARMKEIRANGTGIPFGITLKTPKSTHMYYVNSELIEKITELTKKPTKYTIRCKGNIGFRTYNNRVYKDYNVREIEVLKGKTEHGFHVTFPMVFSEMEKKKFVYRKTMTIVNGLVKANLDSSGQWGYRPIKLGLDKKHLLGGMAITVAKQNNIDELDLINNRVLKVITDPMNEIKGYVAVLISGRLKVGEIIKKPTIDDLNPLERELAPLMGEDKLKEKLDSMEMVKEYFDSTILESIGLGEGQLVEEVFESELNLQQDVMETKTYSNPMADVLADLSNNTEEVKEEVIEQEDSQASVDELDSLLSEKTEEDSQEQEDELDDEFPF